MIHDPIDGEYSGLHISILVAESLVFGVQPNAPEVCSSSLVSKNASRVLQGLGDLILPPTICISKKCMKNMNG
jgi:hypothetical protein